MFLYYLHRRWLRLEEYPRQLHEALDFVPAAPPFVVPSARESELIAHLQAEGDEVLVLDSGDPTGFDPYRALLLAAGAPTYMQPTRDNVRLGRVLAQVAEKARIAVVWRHADRFAAHDFATYSAAVADLMELRSMQQPRRQVELFLLGDPVAMAARAAG